LLIAAAWLGAAGLPAVAQSAAPAGGGACAGLCRFFSGQWAAPDASAGAQSPQAAEPARPGPRAAAAERKRQSASQQGRTATKARTRAATPVAGDVEQTSSVYRASGEMVLATAADGTHGAIAADLAAVLSPEILLRTAPGKALPLKELLASDAADLAIASSLTLARGSAAPDKIVYVSKLFTQELHAVAAPGIRRLDDLRGKPVYLGPRDSDSELAARTFLESRGVTVAPVAGTLGEALKGLRQRRISAVFVLAPKPFVPLTELSSADGHLLPLGYQLSDTPFHPASLKASDYPALVRADEPVETVALDAVLIAPRLRETTPRHKELTVFATHLFDRIGSLVGIGRHPKWQETNLAAQVENVTRLKAAQQWVATRLKISEQASATAAPASATESR
jgi:hypothetical protein